MSLQSSSFLRVAIAGYGTAGAAAATFLARDGHHVTIFEKTPTSSLSESVAGAGLGLQPIGLRILQRLGVFETVVNLGARIDQLRAETTSGRPVLDLAYADFYPNLFGLGVHRSVLFHSLKEAVDAQSERIDVICGEEISSVSVPETKTASSPSSSSPTLTTSSGRTHGPFDLVIVADGRRSLRRNLPGDFKQYERWYDYGCLWAVLPDENGAFAGKRELFQRLDTARVMLGFLPTGCAHPASGPLPFENISLSTPLVSLFWSLEMCSLERVRLEGLDAWKSVVQSYEPRSETLLRHLTSFDQLIPASYSDTWLPKLYYGNSCVFLGDAAHAMSPQLGQGANLALVDAWKLAEAIRRARSLGYPKRDDRKRVVAHAVRAYDHERRWRLRFYQLNSRMLTPIFQSNNDWVARLRDQAMGPLCRFPPTRWQMLATLCGAQDNGIPGAVIPRDEYDIGVA
eukprot:g619.t1